jgi:hypothetical protein
MKIRKLTEENRAKVYALLCRALALATTILLSCDSAVRFYPYRYAITHCRSKKLGIVKMGLKFPPDAHIRIVHIMMPVPFVQAVLTQPALTPFAPIDAILRVGHGPMGTVQLVARDHRFGS